MKEEKGFWEQEKDNHRNLYSLCIISPSMRYRILVVILLVTMCIGQEEAPEEIEVHEETPPPPTEGPPPIPENLIQDVIEAYFDALNERDLNTLNSLTHPFYSDYVKPFLDFVSQNDLTFEIVSVSQLADPDEFRELMKNLSEEQFAQQVGKRGLSYEVELRVIKGGKTYEGFVIFVYIGEVDETWNVLDPETLHLVIEAELEVIESEG